MIKKVLSYLLGAFAWITALFFLFPSLLSLLNSFKPLKNIYDNPFAMGSLSLTNYSMLLEEIPYFSATFNSILITCIVTALIVLFSSMLAYKLSRVNTVLSKAIYMVFIGSMIIPFYAVMIPLIVLAKNLYLSNHIWGLIIIYVGTGVTFPMFLYHGFIKIVPRELDEAAMIDGCGEFMMFFRVIFPLLRPITITVIVLISIGYWNDYFIPLIFINKDGLRTLPLEIYNFVYKDSFMYDRLLPLAVLLAAPVVIFYIFMQKYIIKGIAAGALKA